MVLEMDRSAQEAAQGDHDADAPPTQDSGKRGVMDGEWMQE